MECPFKIPFSTPESPNSMGEFWIYDGNHRALFYVDKKEQADYIVQAINRHEKLVNALMLSETVMSGHISYHTKTPLCENCKINLKDAIYKVQQALKEADEE